MKISTNVRNSTPIIMVIEQIDRAVWIEHRSNANIVESIRLEKVRAKLNPRQEFFLTTV